MKTITLSYDDSQKLRGIAILMMLFLHCFNYRSPNDYIDYTIYGETLSWWLTHMAGLCVPFYCMLSGYGLYIKKTYNYKYCLNKAWYLIKRYWIYLLVFTVIGHCVFDAYDLSPKYLFSNFFGYNTTYNPTLWFLLPYIMILCFSPLLLKWFNKYRILYVILIVFACFVLATLMTKLDNIGVISLPVYILLPFRSIKLLLSFMLGAILARYGIPELNFTKKQFFNNMIIFLFIIILSIIRILFRKEVFAPPIALVLMILLSNIFFKKTTVNILQELGKHSLNMWFIHAYFTYGYLDFTIYCFKYPVLISLAVVIYSYLISKITGPVFTRLNM